MNTVAIIFLIFVTVTRARIIRHRVSAASPWFEPEDAIAEMTIFEAKSISHGENFFEEISEDSNDEPNDFEILGQDDEGDSSEIDDFIMTGDHFGSGSAETIGDDEWAADYLAEIEICKLPCLLGSKKHLFYCESDRCDGKYKCGENADDEYDCPSKCLGSVYNTKSAISCKANIPRFYYDYKSNDCFKFVYGGCGQVVNMFYSYDECIRECHVV